MIFNMLDFARKIDILLNEKEITQDTAITYSNCLKILNREIMTDRKDIEKAIMDIASNRGLVRKYVNAIRKYENIVLNNQFSILSDLSERNLIDQYNTKPSKYKIKELNKDSYLRKINGVHDLKARVTLRLEIQSGLRVSELAKVNAEDITFKDGDIFINVKEGKGRKQRIVKVRRDPYLYEKLQEYIKDKEGKIFNCRREITKKAAKRNIETHDLRRINARMRLQDEMSKGKNFKQAREVVQEQLGHSFPATTDIYLGRKVEQNE